MRRVPRWIPLFKTTILMMLLLLLNQKRFLLPMQIFLSERLDKSKITTTDTDTETVPPVSISSTTTTDTVTIAAVNTIPTTIVPTTVTVISVDNEKSEMEELVENITEKDLSAERD
jgi:hypothetical protein